jgi:DNA replication licensing factor MCM7
LVVAEYIAAVYAEMRMEEMQTEQPHSYTTARTLLSILRLSQALARLRLDDIVTQVSGDEHSPRQQLTRCMLHRQQTDAVQTDIATN